MSSPRDTSKTDPLLLLADAMGPGGPSAAIERQEKQGQLELVSSAVIPADLNGGSEDDLRALGFTLGDPVPGDKLFRYADLPARWKKEGSDHAMWSYIVDEQGRQRCSIFYKAAFYDRSAHISVTSVYGYVNECLYGGTTPVLDESWATREAVLKALEEVRQSEQESVEVWAGRSDSYAAEYEAQSRAKVAKIDALAASLNGGAA
ncbi:hypothetical protein [Streptosporangium sp. NPDC049078]|uniref:hypothetical protein n=1 Tax=Streptosporangium sp. NPDC049078 TaxID=3155767 RepID=UPI003447792D